jgi:hypothetical protein
MRENMVFDLLNLANFTEDDVLQFHPFTFAECLKRKLKLIIKTFLINRWYVLYYLSHAFVPHSDEVFPTRISLY